MTHEFRSAELAAMEMFYEALQSWRWADENQPRSARRKPLFERLADRATYVAFKRTKAGAYLAKVVEVLNEGLNDGWMPDYLFGLRLMHPELLAKPHGYAGAAIFCNANIASQGLLYRFAQLFITCHSSGPPSAAAHFHVRRQGCSF